MRTTGESGLRVLLVLDQQHQHAPLRTMSKPELSAEAQDPTLLHSTLRHATQELSARGLSSSAKWSAELLSCLPVPSSAHFRTSTPIRTGPSTSRHSLPGLPSIGIARGYRDSLGSVVEMEGSSPAPGGGEERMEEDGWTGEEEGEGERRDEEEKDVYLLALAYYRTHELLRAAHALRDCKGPRARWLRCYSKFLVRPCCVFLGGGELMLFLLCAAGGGEEGSGGEWGFAGGQGQGSDEPVLGGTAPGDGRLGAWRSRARWLPPLPVRPLASVVRLD